MTRMEKFSEYHNQIHLMVEDAVIQMALSELSILFDNKTIVDWQELNYNLFTVIAISDLHVVWKYLIEHDNGKVVKYATTIMDGGEWVWREN